MHDHHAVLFPTNTLTTTSAQRHKETTSHWIITQDPLPHHHPDHGRDQVNPVKEPARVPQYHDVGSLLPSLFWISTE